MTDLENSDTLYFEGSALGYGAIAADIRVRKPGARLRLLSVPGLA